VFTRVGFGRCWNLWVSFSAMGNSADTKCVNMQLIFTYLVISLCVDTLNWQDLGCCGFVCGHSLNWEDSSCWGFVCRHSKLRRFGLLRLCVLPLNFDRIWAFSLLLYVGPKFWEDFWVVGLLCVVGTKKREDLWIVGLCVWTLKNEKSWVVSSCGWHYIVRGFVWCVCVWTLNWEDLGCGFVVCLLALKFERIWREGWLTKGFDLTKTENRKQQAFVLLPLCASLQPLCASLQTDRWTSQLWLEQSLLLFFWGWNSGISTNY